MFYLLTVELFSVSYLTPITFKGGESSSIQLRWFTKPKFELFDIFCLDFGAAVAKILKKYKKISPEKSFWKL